MPINDWKEVPIDDWKEVPINDWQEEKQPTGFDNIKSAFAKRIENMRQIDQYARSGSTADQYINSPGYAIKTLGQIAGFGTDVIGQAIEAGMPEGAKKDLAWLLNTAPAKAIRGTMAELKERHPVASDMATDFTNIFGFIPVGKVAQTGTQTLNKFDVGAKAMGKLEDIAGIGTRTKPADVLVNKAIDYGIEKGVKPSVVGKGTFSQTMQYKEKARDAVKTIIENKPSLRLTDEWGKASAKLPENLKQMSQAIDQTKRAIFQKYDTMAKASGEMGAKVDLTGISNELKNVVDSPVLNDLRPDVVKYAKQRMDSLVSRKSYSTVESQDAIAHLNESLEAFYKNPNYENASKASIDAMIANRLRKELDNSIEALEGSGYKELKQKYGSLKAIEKEVSHQAMVDSRRVTKGLLDFSDIFSGYEVVRGLITLNPATLTAGLGSKAIAAYYKYLNNPNRHIKNMFETSERIINKAKKGGQQ